MAQIWQVLLERARVDAHYALGAPDQSALDACIEGGERRRALRADPPAAIAVNLGERAGALDARAQKGQAPVS